MNRHNLIRAAIHAALFTVVPAIAQTQPGDTAPGGDPTVESIVDTIVVTASRREERLQDTPAVVNVVAGDLVENLQVRDTASLTNLVPGLKLDGNTREQVRLGLRGAFNSSTTPGSGQAVGLYVDGVPYTHGSDLGKPLYGIQQVEVLRGPQGTLYGANVVGGLISITTEDPGNELGLEVNASYSSFNRIDGGVYVSGPFSETVSGSLSAYHTRSDGWQENLNTGHDLDALRQSGARAKLVWNPSNAVTLKLIQEVAQDKTRGIPRNWILGDPAGFTPPTDPRETMLVYEGRFDSFSSTTALLANIDFGSVQLDSITSYQYGRPEVIDAPLIVAPQASLTVDRRNNFDLITQELRLSGSTERLQWQTGVFLLDDDAKQYQHYESVGVPNTRLYDRGLRLNILNQDFFVKSKSYSAFAEATYALTDIFGVTLGGRYSYDEKDSFFHNYGEPFPALGSLAEPPFIVEQSADWSEFTPKVTLNAKFADAGPFDALLFYATYSKGYQAGTFTLGATVAAATGAIPPQTAENYEAGFKTTFWDNRATFNVGAFKVDYGHLQSLSFSSSQVSAIASTDAEAQGVEVSASIQPFNGLTLGVDYAYLDTEIAAGARDPSGADVSKNELPQSPPHSFNVYAAYLTSLTSDLDLRLTTAYSYKGRVFFDVRNARTSVLPGVNEMTKQKNLDAEIALLRDRWELSVWGKNLTDEATLTRAFDGVRTFVLSTAEINAGEAALDGTISMPRSVGVTVRYSF